MIVTLASGMRLGDGFGAVGRNCNAAARAAVAHCADFHTMTRASRLPLSQPVRLLRWIARVTLILVPIVISAARIHTHVVEAPDAITQELNQCLRLVNLAASRRLTPAVSAGTRPDCRIRKA